MAELGSDELETANAASTLVLRLSYGVHELAGITVERWAWWLAERS